MIADVPLQVKNLSGAPMKVSENWWQSFFDRNYCILYRHEFAPQRAMEEAEMVERALPLKKSDLILDLCCGHGRHLQVFHQHGFHVVGVDYASVQLDVALSRAEEFDEHYLLARGDARMTPFRAAFDVVVSLNGSFAYFSEDDNRRHLAEVARVLKPGGSYVIDQQNPERLRSLPPRRVTRDPETGATVVEEFEWDAASSRMQARKELTVGKRRKEFYFSVRVYAPDELRALLSAQGLDPARMYGDYDLSEYSPDAARLIYICRKT
jgi:SAM-dependent methyltransferase